MKIKTLLILFISFYASIHAQDYEPVLKEGSFWDVTEASSSGNGCPYLYKYRINGDFVFNDLTYKRLEVSPIRGKDEPESLCGSYGEYFVNENEFTEINNVYLRESMDEKKLYILVFEDGALKEYLMADFSLKVGDFLNNPYTEFSEPLKITSIRLDTDGRKIFSSDNYQSYKEGVGNLEHPIHKYHLPYLGNDISTFSVHCWGNIETQNNCSKVLNTENYKLSSLKIFPNPVGNILQIENIQDVTIKIFSIDGRLMKKEAFKDGIELNVSNLKQGIYFIEISNLMSRKRLKIFKS